MLRCYRSASLRCSAAFQTSAVKLPGAHLVLCSWCGHADMCTAVARILVPVWCCLLCMGCSVAFVHMSWIVCSSETCIHCGMRSTAVREPLLKVMLLCSFGVLLWELMTGDRPKRAQLRPVRYAAACSIWLMCERDAR